MFNDNAPDSEHTGTGSSPLGEQQFLISTLFYEKSNGKIQYNSDNAKIIY